MFAPILPPRLENKIQNVSHKLILSRAMLSFNGLKTIWQDIIGLKEYSPIKIDLKCRGIRSVLQDTIYTACK